MKGKTSLFLCYVLTVAAVLAAVGTVNRTVSTMAETQKAAGKCCIIIDPGHGGEDGGAVSLTGKPESAYNLEISRRLRDLLQLLGYQTRMIRDADVSVYTQGKTLAQKKRSDLQERVRIIREEEQPVLLSIHQNCFPDGRYWGPQVFYAGTEGSEELARQLQDALTGALNPGSRRREKKASGIYLMEHIPCTGVLIECGFLSHREEEALLRDPEYQKKLSAVIAASLSQYLSNT